MEVNLKFEEKDFKSFRDFEKAVKKQLGNNVVVMSDSMCVYFDYPKPLLAMLRPFPPQVQLEFKLESSVPGV